uniref:Uncharacterized protein n=1 Tax=Gouania willdenowi TaxID=441366 RepID=A0A8C5D4F4_GOUWI
ESTETETERDKADLAIRDKAILHQQRRLKQATQFTHKDSADLLPLDGLKRLGTSKDLQPHSIVQRRLLEGNITRLRGEAKDSGARVRSPLSPTASNESPLHFLFRANERLSETPQLSAV